MPGLFAYLCSLCARITYDCWTFCSSGAGDGSLETNKIARCELWVAVTIALGKTSDGDRQRSGITDFMSVTISK